MRVRTHLSLLAAAVFLPMIIGAGVAIKLLLDAERQAVLRGMQELARASVLAMDQELTAALAAGQVLSTSARLRHGDFEAFMGRRSQPTPAASATPPCCARTASSCSTPWCPSASRSARRRPAPPCACAGCSSASGRRYRT
jgi:hypothetical protein